jgi:predicted Holliday junction resolvase-like endonuclease
MKKKKIYLILGILTTIILFTTAALCNWCMVRPEEELVEETEQEPAEEETTEEVEEEPSEEEEKEEIGEEEITEEEEESIREEAEGEVTEEVVEEAEEELSPPTINLKIYYGPQFSPYDAVCYYRIEAEVTGNPTPEVGFSKDDSHGAGGIENAR